MPILSLKLGKFLVKQKHTTQKYNIINEQNTYITDFATTAGLNAVENKIPNFRDLVKKTDYDVK